MRRAAAVLLLAGTLGTAATPAAAKDGAAAEPGIVVLGRRAPPIGGTLVSEAALATMRGGLNLSNGLNISIGIDIQTRVDDVLVLHTIYSTDGPDAGVRVYTDGTAPVSTPPGTLTVETVAQSGSATVTVSRAPTGTTIELAGPTMPATLNILSGAPSTWISGSGEKAVPVTENGPPVATANGDIRLTTDDRGAVVVLDTPDLTIQHLVGQATGAVIANSANNRAIDTIGSINLDVSGLSPEMMSALALGDALALDVATAR